MSLELEEIDETPNLSNTSPTAGVLFECAKRLDDHAATRRKTPTTPPLGPQPRKLSRDVSGTSRDSFDSLVSDQEGTKNKSGLFYVPEHSSVSPSRSASWRKFRKFKNIKI